MSDPVDATTTAAWGRLEELRGSSVPDLREAFAKDPERAQRFTREVADQHVDLSKNLIDDAVLAALVELA